MKIRASVQIEVVLCRNKVNHQLTEKANYVNCLERCGCDRIIAV
jgi:hypothetical protein